MWNRIRYALGRLNLKLRWKVPWVHSYALQESSYSTLPESPGDLPRWWLCPVIQLALYLLSSHLHSHSNPCPTTPMSLLLSPTHQATGLVSFALTLSPTHQATGFVRIELTLSPTHQATGLVSVGLPLLQGYAAASILSFCHCRTNAAASMGCVRRVTSSSQNTLSILSCCSAGALCRKIRAEKRGPA